MLVFAIMVVLVSLSLPMFESTLANQRLRKSADRLRTEWASLRIKAMEEGKIFCFRCAISNNRLLMDRVLDAHFTSSLTYQQEVDSYTGELPPSTLEDGGFTGEEEDFILRDPSQASEETGAKIVSLPEGIVIADVIALPEERAAYYLGLTTATEAIDDENAFESEDVEAQNIRFGEVAGNDGMTWSTPLFFFPDGTTSTAAVLLKNSRGKCVEIRLRGLTATATVCPVVAVENYTGEMNAQTP